jgi:predicted NBD/HSP70 family sugar kinase
MKPGGSVASELRGMSFVPIDSKNAGLRNEKLLLSLLAQHGELSQAQLCELAGLSSSTASYIVGRLREKGLINEKRGESAKRGAKPVIVSIHPRGQLVAGIEVNPAGIHIGLFDFHCEPIESIRAPIGANHSPEVVANILEINLRGLLSKHDVNDDRLVGIGVTLSGSITFPGVVTLSSALGWKDVPFREILQKRFQAPIHVYTNRVRMFAEISMLPTTADKNLLLLNFGDTVGASVSVDGQLLLGHANRAGDVGHVILDPNGPKCACGERGCVDTYISGPAVAARIRKDLENDAETVLRERIEFDATSEEVFEQLGKAIAEGDPYALQIREYVAEYVARTASIAINCYDPQVLVLNGYVCAQCPDYLIKAITKTFTADVHDKYAREITIFPARCGEQALIRGIATAVIATAVIRNSMENL